MRAGACTVIDIVIGDGGLWILLLPRQRLGEQELRIIGARRGAIGENLPRGRFRRGIIAAGEGGIALLQRDLWPARSRRAVRLRCRILRWWCVCLTGAGGGRWSAGGLHLEREIVDLL